MLDAALARQPMLPRFLCHLYQELNQGRLNLVTGAGISIDAKVPGWEALLKRLSECDPQLAQDVKMHFAEGRNPEYLGQILYRRRSSSVPEGDHGYPRKFVVDGEWAKAVHEALYKDVPEDIDEVVAKHPYLAKLRDLTAEIPLIINFNFDDIFAAAIDRQISQGHRQIALSVVWRPPLVDRPKATTIYHVNGILPRISLKKRSEQLIFTEDSFADAMARSPGIEAEYIFLRFVQNTMLIIGHSLSDSSLKNHLRRSKDKSPANHHYMIHWMEEPDAVPNSIREDIFFANLKLYNLITIFLSSREMNEFFSILKYGEREFSKWANSSSPDRRSCFKYYIVGPVASGKSTLLEHLRCFQTYEEWTRPPPREMYMSFEKLTEEQSNTIDAFIYDELKEKNKRLHGAQIGFHFMDRAPLDLYAFSKDRLEEQKKTEKLIDQITRHERFVDGEVIFIFANGEALMWRNLKRGRSPEEAGTAEYFEQQTEKLRSIYEPTKVYQSDVGADVLARKVARDALLGPYSTTDLNEIMKRYA